MAAYPPTVLPGQRACQVDRISLHYKIDIEVGTAQQQIPCKAADGVQRAVQLLGSLTGKPQQLQQRLRQPGLHAHGDPVPLQGLFRHAPQVDQVGTRSDGKHMTGFRRVLSKEAIEYKFYSVCVNSGYVRLAKELTKNSSVKVCSVIGFPLGASSTKTKVFEAVQAVEDGAQEIDMVMNIGLLKSSNYLAVLKDITDVKVAIGKIPLKVILEISELSKNEIIKASEICLDAKADFVKTSTGFSKSGATLTAVRIIKKTVKDQAKIKASGGIKDYETALKYIETGADRLGTSSGVAIMNKQLSTSNY